MSHPTSQQDHRIVVGVDGSAGSKTALRWAMTQARLTGATIEAVAVWQDPTMNGYSLGWAPGAYAGEDLAQIAQKNLDDTIDEVRAGLEQPVEVGTRVLQGPAAMLLPEVAAGAQLLVVGSRGHGAFAGMVLGSVSQHCVQHLTCPVVVVPPSDPTPAG